MTASAILASKVCKRCQECKPLTSFYKSASTKDGRQGVCSHCRNAMKAEYRAANHDKHTAANRAWERENSGKRKVYAAAHRPINPAYHRARVALWKSENIDKKRMHDQNRRAKKINAGGVLSKGLAAKLLKMQKGICPCCVLPLGNDYHLDHIMPLALGGTNTDDNIQLLHAMCNSRKGANNPIDFMQKLGLLL